MEYLFGDFRLDSAARELWQSSSLVHVNRRGFDCLLYLIEHRDRAVGRDELVAALWGRVDVTDSQVNQAVLRARLAVSDDGQAQNAIRTVPGFGYRWVMDTEARPITKEDASVASRPVAETSPQKGAPGISPAVDPGLVKQRRWPLKTFVGSALALLLVALVVYRVSELHSPPPPPTRTERTTTVVLPLEVSAPREAGWVRLGAMDLIADRLRSAGMPVPSSDSVVSAVHAIGEPLDAARTSELANILGAAIVVGGSATKSPSGWKVELSATAADGTHLRETAEQTDIMDAARRATDMLLAALGRQPGDATEHSDADELLQRAQAALLAVELDTARGILTSAPAHLQNDPHVRAKLAQIDFRAGNFDAAAATLDALVDDPAVQAEPRLLAQVLTTLGFIDIRHEDCKAAERRFDAAVAATERQATLREHGVAIAARGLSRACAHDFENAANDLGKARAEMDAAGDRLGVAKVNNYLGVLEVERGRPADAVPYFVAAANTVESFGVFESLRANLSALFIAQAHLLRWSDALKTTGRLWATREHTRDPELLLATSGFRVQALTALGRFAEADAVVAEAERQWPGKTGESTRFYYAAHADLAWRQGNAQGAFDAAGKALAVWPKASDADSDGQAAVALLRQRASIALGNAAEAQPPAVTSEAGLPSGFLVARAEWAAREGRDEDAERYFRAATAKAEQGAFADVIALANEAYADWLLARKRGEDAGTESGRIAAWADRDFDCALLQVRVFHATGHEDAWRVALGRAQNLLGERTLQPDLLKPPS